MVSNFSKTEIEKSHVDMVSVSKIKMEANIATVLKTAAQMNLAFVANPKSQVRIFPKNQIQKIWKCKCFSIISTVLVGWIPRFAMKFYIELSICGNRARLRENGFILKNVQKWDFTRVEIA